MKSRIILSIALVLSVVLLSLMKSDSTANAAPPQRYKSATGVLTPAAGQTVRVSVVAADPNSDVSARFMWVQYMADGCTGTPSVCSHSIASQGATPNWALGSRAHYIDVPGDGNGVNVTLESNSPKVQVNIEILNEQGTVVAFSDILLTN